MPKGSGVSRPHTLSLKLSAEEYRQLEELATHLRGRYSAFNVDLPSTARFLISEAYRNWKRPPKQLPREEG